MKRVLVKFAQKSIGKKIKVCGWVDSRRDHGKLIFIDLRDRSGILQVVFKPAAISASKKLKAEWVICIEGKIEKRPKGTENLEIKTGKVEMVAENLEILSEAKNLPFEIGKAKEVREETRLKYRYLDLRRPEMREVLEIRQKVIQFMREFLQKKEFLEVETPILGKSTPEGARDFLVPSRLQPGEFYALPQSPQQYKQMLMVSGIEKYFQIARALRDEDPRADRQAEHTQLDIEISFTSQEEILNLIEELFTKLVKKIFPEKKITKTPFIRMTYKEAMEKYKSDKPDLRKSKKDPNELAFAFITDFPMFERKENPASAKAAAGKEKRLVSRSSKSEGRWGAMHHPFTKPQTENIKEIKKHPEKILAYQYDFVLNGCEIAGGSLRNTDLEILTAVFEVLGHKKEKVKKQFGNYFEAFSYGVPPHGGIAPGIDRFLAVILNKPNIREVIAFPKTGDGRDLSMSAPSEVEKEQLEELHIKVVKKRQ